MPLVDAKCTNCGATLVVDSAKDAAICNFCGSAFIVEKAINNYNVVNHNYINADVVNVYNTNSVDFVIRTGRLLEYCGASVNVNIPEGVTVIGERAFAGLDRLKSVTIPNSVEVIEYGAFSDCISLSNILIPDSVERIDDRAFENCKHLYSITVSNKVTSIPQGVFSGCDNLHQVYYLHLDKNVAAFRGTPFHLQQWGTEWECQFCNHKNPADTKWCLSCGFENIDVVG